MEPSGSKVPKIDLDCEEGVSKGPGMQKECVSEMIISSMVLDEMVNQCDPKKVAAVLKFYMSVLTTQYEENGKKPIPYYRYIVDTSDFDKTKNNMFNTSIIINRGMAGLDVDEHNRAVLWPVEKEELAKFKTSGEKNNSVVTSLTYELWETFRDEANGTEGYLQEAMRLKSNT